MKSVLNMIRILCGLLSAGLLLAFLYYTVLYQHNPVSLLQAKANIALFFFVMAILAMALSFIAENKDNLPSQKLYRTIDALSGKVEALIETRVAPTDLRSASGGDIDGLAQSVVKLSQGIQTFNEKNIAALEALSAQIAFINQQQNVLSDDIQKLSERLNKISDGSEMAVETTIYPDSPKFIEEGKYPESVLDYGTNAEISDDNETDIDLNEFLDQQEKVKL